MNIEIHQPHDALFKASFSHKQVMVDFLTSRLPQETLARIELGSLRLTNKSFVSKIGRHRHSDLIYEARIDKQEGYIYIVTEHFSEQEKYIPLTQLEYNLPLMRQHLNEGHEKLPIILNLCVYNVRHEVAHAKCMPRHTGVASTPHCHTLGARRVIP